MRTIMTTAILIAMTVTAFSQNVIDRHFSAYQQDDDFTKVHVTGTLFGLAAHIDNEDNDPEVEEFKEFVQHIDAFDLVASDEMGDSKAAFKTAVRKVENEYEELMSIDDKDGRFLFLIDEENGVVRELVGVGASPDHFVIFSLSGSMDLKQLSNMGQKLQSGGLEKIGELKSKSIDEIKIYPNPAPRNGAINIELPEAMTGGELTVYDLNGGVMLKQQTTQRRLQLKTDLAAGQYVVEMKKEGVSVKRKLTVQ